MGHSGCPPPPGNSRFLTFVNQTELETYVARKQGPALQDLHLAVHALFLLPILDTWHVTW